MRLWPGRFIDGAVRGFTLIELLVVVSILAILAAIGVSNFLEAQVRSKLSRTRGDMRTAATALELYATDNGAYPPNMSVISTPVAYVSSQVPDIFANKAGSPYLGYVNAVAMSDPALLTAFSVTNFNDASRAMLSSYQWFVFSNGPDIEDYALQHSQKAFDDVVNAPGADYGLFYDPTNGTVSGGDVIRCPRYAK